MAKHEGCDGLLLRMPVLRSCGKPAPTWALEWSQGGSGIWSELQPRTPGGLVHVGGMSSEQTARFRLREDGGANPRLGASTAPLLPYYADKGLLMTVDGMNSIDEVGQAIDVILG